MTFQTPMIDACACLPLTVCWVGYVCSMPWITGYVSCQDCIGHLLTRAAECPVALIHLMH